MIERRKYKRISITIPIKLVAIDSPEKDTDAQIINIGAEGIGVINPRIFPVGTQLLLSFKLREDLEFENIAGKVNRTNIPHKDFLAMNLVILEKEDKEKLNRYISSIRILKNTMPFRELNYDELHSILSIGKEQFFPDGKIIFSENDHGDAFYIITSGRIKISKKRPLGGEEEVLALLREGEFFGEMALLEDRKRSAIASANRNSVLLVISKDKFRKLMESATSVATKLLWIFTKILSHRLRQADEKICDSFLLPQKSLSDRFL